MCCGFFRLSSGVFSRPCCAKVSSICKRALKSDWSKRPCTSWRTPTRCVPSWSLICSRFSPATVLRSKSSRPSLISWKPRTKLGYHSIFLASSSFWIAFLYSSFYFSRKIQSNFWVFSSLCHTDMVLMSSTLYLDARHPWVQSFDYIFACFRDG